MVLVPAMYFGLPAIGHLFSIITRSSNPLLVCSGQVGK
jgi:hypothetical protein